MNYPTVGKTGIQVTNLCFGKMSFGGKAEEETSKAMFKRCREVGINFFDMANVNSLAVLNKYWGNDGRL